MDFSRFENSIKAEQAKFNEIKNVKDASKFDEICNGLNKTLEDISLVASYVPVESKKGLISLLRTMRDFAVELIGYKNSFNEEKVEPIVDEEVPEETNDKSQSESESQSLEKGNAKVLSYTNPAVPKQNVYAQFNQAA